MITIKGTNGADNLIGSGFDEEILGLGGDDFINASSGHDNIRGGNGNDTIWAENGFDFVNAGAGDDIVDAGGGNDTVLGGAGDDTIYGGGGTDLLYGNTGNDTIYTGTGPDQSWGGDGDDTIIDEFTNGGVEYMNGGAGNDTLVGFGYGDLGHFANRTSYEMFGESGNDQLRVSNVPAWLDGGADDDIIELAGYGGTAIGGDGNDKIYGGARANIWDKGDFGVHGGFGPGGSQVLDGGRGNDTIFGFDATHDTLIFRPGDGRDTVFNFSVDDEMSVADRIDLTAFGFGMSAQEVVDRYATERDGRTILRFDADSTMVLVGVEAADLVHLLII